MTDVCRFDFSRFGSQFSAAAVRHGSGQWQLHRGSRFAPNHLLSHDAESFFWMRRNSGVGKQSTRHSNDFSAKIFLLAAPGQRLMLKSCSRDSPSKRKQTGDLRPAHRHTDEEDRRRGGSKLSGSGASGLRSQLRATAPGCKSSLVMTSHQ